MLYTDSSTSTVVITKKNVYCLTVTELSCPNTLYDLDITNKDRLWKPNEQDKYIDKCYLKRQAELITTILLIQVTNLKCLLYIFVPLIVVK